jgi:hypothetical protein
MGAAAGVAMAEGGGSAERGPGLLPVAICVLFAIPLIFGLRSISSAVRLSNRASHFAHDVASMYRQGVDFSRPENQNIIFDLAHAQALPIQPDHAVIILSTIRMVSDADCSLVSADACVNRGQVVVQQQLVLGDPRLHASAFGVDPPSGPRGWLTERAARVADFGTALRPGEIVHAAETWFATPDQPAGIYVRSMN